jgi:hypothetical protein
MLLPVGDYRWPAHLLLCCRWPVRVGALRGLKWRCREWRLSSRILESRAHGYWMSRSRILDAGRITDFGSRAVTARLYWAVDEAAASLGGHARGSLSRALAAWLCRCGSAGRAFEFAARTQRSVRVAPKRPPEILYMPLFNSSFSGETPRYQERSGQGRLGHR